MFDTLHLPDNPLIPFLLLSQEGKPSFFVLRPQQLPIQAPPPLFTYIFYPTIDLGTFT
jgi:hypothetical protein